MRVTTHAGYSVAEMVSFIVIAGIVAGSLYQFLNRPDGIYLAQWEPAAARGSLRSAGSLLASELRGASVAEGDLYSLGPDYFEVRSIQGAGTICAAHDSEPRYGLWGTTGYFAAAAEDSAMAIAAGDGSQSDGKWLLLKLENVFSSGGGVPKCEWGAGSTLDTEFVVEVETAASSKIPMGSSFIAFRRVGYGVLERDGRWWLGRKVGASGSYDILTGPLRPGDGFTLTYYDQVGDPTTDPAQVRLVEIDLRGEGLRSGPTAQEDSVSIRVALRG